MTTGYAVTDEALRTCTYVGVSGWRCAALPTDEIHTSPSCESGHPEAHHAFVPEPPPKPQVSVAMVYGYEAGIAAERERWEDALQGALSELSESPLPGARYGYEVVRGRFQALVVAPIPATTDVRVVAR